ncbi:MAG: hypothetical protein BroJett030_11430 [Alphaproteobacteria bacterium]|nr:MAG: hypothetical protein BroJett030_11430 [Alphaproteobacteria bacterium]
MRKLMLALSFLGFAAVPALAAPPVDFATADADGDGQVTLQEAQTVGVSDAQFTTADADGSGGLSEEEWNAIE